MEVKQVPGVEAYPSVFDFGDSTIAVPLDLEKPVRVVERLLRPVCCSNSASETSAEFWRNASFRKWSTAP
jgi:hypothetical protein